MLQTEFLGCHHGELQRREDNEFTLRCDTKWCTNNRLTPSNPQTNVLWFRLGRGSKAHGFSPNGWVAVVNGQFFLRRPGNGQRGVYWVTAGHWCTIVEPIHPVNALRLAVRAAVAEDPRPKIGASVR